MLAGCDIPIFTNGVSRDGVDLSVMHACMFFVKFLCLFVSLLLLFFYSSTICLYMVWFLIQKPF